MTTHLAVLHREYLDKIISGEKTIESRLTRTRRAPWGKIKTGDTIYFKQSSGPIRAVAKAGKVLTLTDLTPDALAELRAKHNDKITGSDATWATKQRARYGTLIWLSDVRQTSDGPIIPPLYGAAWVCNPEQRAVARQ